MTNIAYNNLTIHTQSLRGKITIRMDYTATTFIEKWPSQLAPLPKNIGTMTYADNQHISAIGPNELLYYCELDEVNNIMAMLHHTYDTMFVQIIEVSDYYYELLIQGDLWRDLCERLIFFDFRNFKPGHVIGVSLANANVALSYMPQGVIMQYRASFHEYIIEHLRKNTREFAS